MKALYIIEIVLTLTNYAVSWVRFIQSKISTYLLKQPNFM